MPPYTPPQDPKVAEVEASKLLEWIEKFPHYDIERQLGVCLIYDDRRDAPTANIVACGKTLREALSNVFLRPYTDVPPGRRKRA